MGVVQLTTTRLNGASKQINHGKSARARRSEDEPTDLIDFAAAWLLRRATARAIDEANVRAVLGDVFTPAGVETWLTTPNVAFGGRSALTAIAAGDGDVVIRRAEFIAGGAQ